LACRVLLLSGGTRLAVGAAARIRAGVAPFGVPNDGMRGMAQAVADGRRRAPTGPGSRR
jgi:hypothetical protein